jgi:ribosomal-protein-alanine N-acetyltransferase
MTPAQMAQIHHDAFAPERGWSAAEFADLLAQPHTTALSASGGFALTRTVADESELLTLAVAPAQRRRGIAAELLERWITAAQAQADSAFLEVAADNAAALALYSKHGFVQNGRRKDYYARAGTKPVDALLMTRALTRG